MVTFTALSDLDSILGTVETALQLFCYSLLLDLKHVSDCINVSPYIPSYTMPFHIHLWYYIIYGIIYDNIITTADYVAWAWLQ